jgi:hypothetical protein
MIKDIIDLLNKEEFLVGDLEIEFAKGSHKIPETVQEGIKQYERKKQTEWLRKQ